MKKLESILDKNIWLWIVILSLPAIWALFVPGFYGASDDLHMAWLYEFHKTLLLGQIPPRFVPDLSFGFGYPLFNFVFPLPFYIAEIFHLLGLNLVDSVKALFLLSVPFSAFFMYLFLRQFTNKALSLAGAILYIYTPYRSTDIYVRGAIGEILSFVILPVVALSVAKLSADENSNRFSWIGIGALSIASLILTHNITAYMFLPFIGLFWILRIIFLVRNKGKMVVLSLTALIAGLLISCYFWIPAISESVLMKYDTVFNFVDHFPTLIQLIKPYWGYGASVPGPYDGMSFFLGYVNIGLILIVLISFFSFKISKEKKILLTWVFISLICAAFLMNFRSSFLWSTLPLLPYFQFPWRFLIITTFVIPILVINLEAFKKSWLFSVLIIFLSLVTVGSFFRPHDFLGRQDSYYLNRYIPSPVASSEYLKTQEEYLRLPKGTEARPGKNYPFAYADSGNISKIYKKNDLNVLVWVQSSNGVDLNLSKYFFPGWIALIDGQRVNIEPGKPFGQVSVKVPSGAHKVEFLFKETNFKKVLDVVSLIAFLVSLRLALWTRLKKYVSFF